MYLLLPFSVPPQSPAFVISQRTRLLIVHTINILTVFLPFSPTICLMYSIHVYNSLSPAQHSPTNQRFCMLQLNVNLLINWTKLVSCVSQREVRPECSECIVQQIHLQLSPRKLFQESLAAAAGADEE